MAKKVRAKQVDFSGLEVRQSEFASNTPSATILLSDILAESDNNQALLMLQAGCSLTLHLDVPGPYHAKTIRLFTYGAIGSIQLTKPDGAQYNVLTPCVLNKQAGAVFYLSWRKSPGLEWGEWILYNDQFYQSGSGGLPVNAPTWEKQTLTYDIATESIDLNFDSEKIITGLFLRVTTPYDGPDFTSVGIKIGVTSEVEKYVPLTSIMTTGVHRAVNIPDLTSDLKLQFTATGNSLGNLTQGALDIYILRAQVA
jgi:hypothetical protein